MRRAIGLLLYGLLGLLGVLILGGGLSIGPVFLLLGQPIVAWLACSVGGVLAVLALLLRWRLRLPLTPYFEQVLAIMGVIVFFWACSVWSVRQLRDVENYTGNNDPYVERLPAELTPENLQEQFQDLYRRLRERYDW